MPTIKVSLGIGFYGAKHHDEIEISEEEWNECKSDMERDRLINEIATEWAWNYIDIGAEVIE